MSNLLRLILERLDYERLIEEGKDPVEVLHFKYKDVPSNIIDKIIEIDPTKKKSFSQWLLSKWENEKPTIVKNLGNGRIEKLFQHFKNHQDVQIKDCPSVAEGLRDYVPEEDTVLTKSDKPTTYLKNLDAEVDSELANDFDIVFNKDNWIIAVPNTYEAECKLGENMNWCTANAFGNGESYYNRYLSDYGGNYYVNFDLRKGESREGKDYPFTRYQFHFESNQFMDKNDDPVTYDEIDMPDSVAEFYQGEGYDVRDMESEEARMDRYYEERSQYYYWLNDELYIAPAFDEDYDFRVPNENTGFYIFDENDDRDPIDWTEIKNPMTNNDVFVRTDNQICILKTTDDRFVFAVNEGGRWRDWSAYSMKEYIELPNEFGYFGYEDYYKRQFISINDRGTYTIQDIPFNECVDMFVNTECTDADAEEWRRIFVEVVLDNYDALFTIDMSDGELECVIKKDIPINEKYYTIDEQGYIEGNFRKYKIYNDDDYEEDEEDDEFMTYNLYKELPSGNYIIDKAFEGSYVFNYLKRGERKPRFETWFKQYMGDLYEVLPVFTFNGGKFIVGKDGDQLGELYDSFGRVDKENGILSAALLNDKGVDLINVNESSIIRRFKKMVSYRGVNDMVVIIDLDGESRVYNYMNDTYCFEDYKDFMRISSYDTDNKIFCCRPKNADVAQYVMINLETGNIVADKFNKVKKLYGDTKYIEITKLNGKINVVDTENARQILPEDVDEILDSPNYTFRRIPFKSNGRYYLYDYMNNVFEVNPNGFSIPFEYHSNGNLIFKQGSNVVEIAKKDNQYQPLYWRVGFNNGYFNNNNQEVPQEIQLMVNDIFNTQQKVSESFNRFMKRIDEVKK